MYSFKNHLRMNSFRIPRLYSILLIAFLSVSLATSQSVTRVVENFNNNWRFYKGDVPVALQPGYDDSGWRTLNLPHDWSIEGPFDKKNASGTGFLPGGIGWYRKSFTVPADLKNSKVFIYFDGVYNNSEVWINGAYLGKRPNGYISFEYDLTPYINPGKENFIAVKVDHTKFGDSRWYTGSGIYRDVKLIYTPVVHIRKWGVSYSTPEVSSDRATIKFDVKTINESDKSSAVTFFSYLVSGKDTIGKFADKAQLAPGKEKIFSHTLSFPKPRLWDIDNPSLYSLVTVLKGKNFADQMTTTVGFRNIRFDPDKGFFLNGRKLKLKGICMHHDAGSLGSAVPRKEIERRLDILKELGCNAIRTSHNPFSSDFLDLCDRKGFLVIDEAFDEWELPKKKWIEGWNKGTPGKDGYSSDFIQWANTDIADFVMRDRHHPSVIMWSIGNEIDYPNDPYTHPILNTEANPQTWAKFDPNLPDANRLGLVARQLVAVVKQLDSIRPVTAGLASALMSNETGYAEALDVTGYNYQEFRYRNDHQKYPKRVMYGSENGMTLEAWNAVAENDYVAGQFLWTGFEYLGEAGQFPSRHSTSGIIDLAGNKKPEFFFRQSLWSDKPMVYLGTTNRISNQGEVNLWSHKRVDAVWNWKEGQTISVNAFTNCETVELFLNDKSLGVKNTREFQNRVIAWEVPYEAGNLKAVARNGGNVAAAFELNTSGTPVNLTAVCDASTLKADNTDLAHIFINITDDAGNTVYSALNEITVEVSGPARLIGTEDANPVNIEDYKDNKQKAFHGKLLVYIQPTDKTGKANITVSSPGLKSSSVQIEVVK
jgi:beta-galactosidase